WFCLCLALGTLRGNERRFGRRHAGGDQDQATGRSGKKLSEEDKKELFESVKKTYDDQMDPRYGAARLWIDKIIDPMETRAALTTALEAAALNPEVKEFKVGVLQT